MSKFKILLSAAGLALMAISGNLQAAPIVYFGEDLNAGTSVGPNATAARNSFLGAVPGAGTEDFESFGAGTSPPLALSFPGSITANLTGTGGVVIADNTYNGRFATSGTKWLSVSSNNNFTITFSSAVSAFGFLGTDIGDYVNGNLTLSLTDSSNVVTQQIVNHTTGSTADNNVLFWGFTDAGNSYKSISFSNPGGGDVFGFDDLTVGNLLQTPQQPTAPVAEPGTLALFGLGLAGLGFARRRKAA